MILKAPACSHMSRLMLGTDFDNGISHGGSTPGFSVAGT